MVSHSIPPEHLPELRVRQAMIDHEREIVIALRRMLQHEEYIVRVLEEMIAHLKEQGLHLTYKDEYENRQKTLRQQRKEVKALTHKIHFQGNRLEALSESLSFYLVKLFGIDASLPWMLDIENECISLQQGEVQV